MDKVCFYCKKILEYNYISDCKCKHIFCSNCRSPENHMCTFLVNKN